MTIGNGLMGFSYNYPMMENNIAMMQIGNQNTMQYLTCKYGCADCFRHEPFVQDFPKAITLKPKEAMQPSAWTRFWRKVLG